MLSHEARGPGAVDTTVPAVAPVFSRAATDSDIGAGDSAATARPGKTMNPRGTGKDTVEGILKGRSPQVCDWTPKVRRLVKRLAPEAEERPIKGWKAIWYYRNDGFAANMPLKDRMNLGFARGTDLPDPTHLLEGTGKRMRLVKIRSDKDLRSAALKELIRAAYDLSGRT
jgi:hypothetical protein